MNYKLNRTEESKKKKGVKSSLRFVTPLLVKEKKKLIITLLAVITNSLSSMIAPIIIGLTIDDYIKTKDYDGILYNSGILLLIYIIGSLASYIQTKAMGGVGRRLLYKIRNSIFNKIQELPIEFFNQNKSGDLISRINSDTEKLNQFISQALMQFVGNFFLICGTGIFMLILSFKLALATLLPALLVLLATQALSPWLKKKNLESLTSTGGVSSEIQESLSNFKVIIAFNRLDYFTEKFRKTNEMNYKAALGAGIANNVFIPIYGLASNLAFLINLCFGLYLISHGNITLGLLIGFQFYVNNFYSPLRQLASVWSTFQLSLASLDRISEVLSLKSNLKTIESPNKKKSNNIIEFNDVSFHYPDGENILNKINLSFEKGKTYALVGPTGGGKTTTASLMARLFDPSKGTIYLDSRDIRSYSNDKRTKMIGFILQEPFLFSGTIKDNIIYGNEKYESYDSEKLTKILIKNGLNEFIEKFEFGLDTNIVTSSESISLGQKQLIAFIRAFLRDPDLLILDEATANIDTMTEIILEKILTRLPKKTTKVIIAHRLNTIRNADEIYFVNAGTITKTGSMEDALSLLQSGKRDS